MRASLLLACLIAALLWAAPSASAITYCVPPATGCQQGATGVQDALDEAAGHKGLDTLKLQTPSGAYEIEVEDPAGGTIKPPPEPKTPAAAQDSGSGDIFGSVKGWMLTWLPIIFMGVICGLIFMTI